MAKFWPNSRNRRKVASNDKKHHEFDLPPPPARHPPRAHSSARFCFCDCKTSASVVRASSSLPWGPPLASLPSSTAAWTVGCWGGGAGQGAGDGEGEGAGEEADRDPVGDGAAPPSVGRRGSSGRDDRDDGDAGARTSNRGGDNSTGGSGSGRNNGDRQSGKDRAAGRPAGRDDGGRDEDASAPSEQAESRPAPTPSAEGREGSSRWRSPRGRGRARDEGRGGGGGAGGAGEGDAAGGGVASGERRRRADTGGPPRPIPPAAAQAAPNAGATAPQSEGRRAAAAGQEARDEADPSLGKRGSPRRPSSAAATESNGDKAGDEAKEKADAALGEGKKVAAEKALASSAGKRSSPRRISSTASSPRRISSTAKSNGDKSDEVKEAASKAPPSGKRPASVGAGPSMTAPPSLLRSLPPPLPSSGARHVVFLADGGAPNLASSALDPRGACTLTFDSGFQFDRSGSAMDDATHMDVRRRLQRWDPYWRIVAEVGGREVLAAKGAKEKTTTAWTRTASCQPVAKFRGSIHLPRSCAAVTVDWRRDAGYPWGVNCGDARTRYCTGDRRLLLRALPLKRPAKDAKKRSDDHLWPIGTFLQVSHGGRQRAIAVAQRRQQSHDPRLWKGICRPLDLTPYLPRAAIAAASPLGIELCAREAVAAPEERRYEPGTRVSKVFEDDDGAARPFAGTVTRFDARHELYQVVYEDGDAEELTGREVKDILAKKEGDAEEARSLSGSYGLHLAVCEYIGPDDLYDQLMGAIPTISLDSSRTRAKKYMVNQTVSLHSDDEGDSFGGDCSLTFSLLCPISKMAIGTPVRGAQCKHMQCFDLKSFLHSNKHVSGGRWRCGVCEDFLSTEDLVRCGLFDAMLRDHRHEVSGARDKVSFQPDGTWELREENKLRYSGKSRGTGGAGGGDKKAKQDEGDSSRNQPEVIDLL
ncbi:hypothetical protein ACHAWF_007438 [Thalassiosira exigua]